MNDFNAPENRPPEEDAALARRLARLGRKPVDTEALERRLDAAFMSLDDGEQTEPVPLMSPPPHRLGHWLQPAAGLAAMLALVLTLFFALSTSLPTASAAVVELTDLHRSVEEGRYAVPAAFSIEGVNQLIAEQRSGAAVLPEKMQAARVQLSLIHI